MEKQQKRSSGTPDCRTCGACCIGGYDDGGGWADCTVEDVIRMSRRVRDQLVSLHVGWATTDKYLATPTVFSESFGDSCKFLRGTPGKRVSCRIYETRPEVCRDFKPGSKRCKEARREIEERLEAA